MSGTRAGGLKTKAKNLARDPNFYKRIGQKGGLNNGEEHKLGGSKPKGFAADPKRAAKVGAIGGRRSRRGKNTYVKKQR